MARFFTLSQTIKAAMSLKGIAKQLGLSITTVSRALNGYSDVSQETR